MKPLDRLTHTFDILEYKLAMIEYSSIYFRTDIGNGRHHLLGIMRELLKL